VSEEILTRDLSSGRIHKRTVVGEGLQTFDCERCFADIPAPEAAE
jgi:hypothetical protein